MYLINTENKLLKNRAHTQLYNFDHARSVILNIDTRSTDKLLLKALLIKEISKNFIVNFRTNTLPVMTSHSYMVKYTDGLVQERRNSSAMG